MKKLILPASSVTMFAQEKLQKYKIYFVNILVQIIVKVYCIFIGEICKKYKKYVKNMMKLAKYSKKSIENKVNFFTVI